MPSLSKIWATGKRRKWPGNSKQNQYQSYQKPFKYDPEFIVIICSSLCDIRTCSDNTNCHNHQRHMDNGEKQQVSIFDSHFKIRPEGAYQWTLSIECYTHYKLQLGKTHRCMDQQVVKFRIGRSNAICTPRFYRCQNKAKQNKPSNN